MDVISSINEKIKSYFLTQGPISSILQIEIRGIDLECQSIEKIMDVFIDHLNGEVEMNNRLVNIYFERVLPSSFHFVSRDTHNDRVRAFFVKTVVSNCNETLKTLYVGKHPPHCEAVLSKPLHYIHLTAKLFYPRHYTISQWNKSIR